MRDVDVCVCRRGRVRRPGALILLNGATIRNVDVDATIRNVGATMRDVEASNRKLRSH